MAEIIHGTTCVAGTIHEIVEDTILKDYTNPEWKEGSSLKHANGWAELVADENPFGQYTIPVESLLVPPWDAGVPEEEKVGTIEINRVFYRDTGKPC